MTLEAILFSESLFFSSKVPRELFIVRRIVRGIREKNTPCMHINKRCSYYIRLLLQIKFALKVQLGSILITVF